MIEIESTGPRQYAVTITEHGPVTTHRVTVPPALLDELKLSASEEEPLVRESFEFLLEREPNTAILRQFSLSVITQYFPEYSLEMRRRIGP